MLFNHYNSEVLILINLPDWDVYGIYMRHIINERKRGQAHIAYASTLKMLQIMNVCIKYTKKYKATKLIDKSPHQHKLQKSHIYFCN